MLTSTDSPHTVDRIHTPYVVQFRCGADATGREGWCEVSATVIESKSSSLHGSPAAFCVHGTARCARGKEASCATLHPLAAKKKSKSSMLLPWPATFTLRVPVKATTHEWVSMLMRKDEEVLEAAGRTAAHVPRDPIARQNAVALRRILALQALAKEHDAARQACD